ncbi:nuclear transport factor 2 family protein [Alphaproteobacteria bacterium]|nr:nuclear transport factor 2 family protein [Alphaproteobacteria bacterium]
MDDRAQISQVITQYVEAYLQADVEALRDAFAYDAVMNGHLGDRLVTGSPEVFIQNVGKAPPIATLGGTPSYEIGEIEITGNAAAVTVRETGFGELNFTDYMHLLKRDGRWKIISKTFSTF